MPEHKTSLTLLREWREHWIAHGEIRLVEFVVQVENYIAGLHETIRHYNSDDSQLDHEKRVLSPQEEESLRERCDLMHKPAEH